MSPSRQFYVFVSYGEDAKLACDVIFGTVPLNSTLALINTLPVSPSQVVITQQPTAPRLAIADQHTRTFLQQVLIPVTVYF